MTAFRPTMMGVEMIKRTQSEIDEVMNWAGEAFDEGSRFPGMSYEEGIMAAIDWLMGHTEDRPDSD